MSIFTQGFQWIQSPAKSKVVLVSHFNGIRHGVTTILGCGLLVAVVADGSDR